MTHIAETTLTAEEFTGRLRTFQFQTSYESSSATSRPATKAHQLAFSLT
jgi:hypothetical protein